MQPSPPTQPKTFTKSWAVSGRHIKILSSDFDHGSGRGLTFKHYSLGAWTGVFTWLRLPVLWLDNLWWSLDSELNRRIGKAATTISSLTKRVWSNKKLTQNTKIQVYRAYVLSTLLYGSVSLTKSADCAGRTVIPELVFSATQVAVREQPIRARHSSLSRL